MTRVRTWKPLHRNDGCGIVFSLDTMMKRHGETNSNGIVMDLVKLFLVESMKYRYIHYSSV